MDTMVMLWRFFGGMGCCLCILFCFFLLGPLGLLCILIVYFNGFFSLCLSKKNKIKLAIAETFLRPSKVFPLELLNFIGSILCTKLIKPPATIHLLSSRISFRNIARRLQRDPTIFLPFLWAYWLIFRPYETLLLPSFSKLF